jgi:DNA-directed RNA polymerase subunit RPC12/RpoP
VERKDAPMTFFCPRCRESFQFNDVSKDQFVPCPNCGIELLVIKKNQDLLLEPLGFDLKNPEIQNNRVVEVR